MSKDKRELEAITQDLEKIPDIMKEIGTELATACRRFPPYRSSHEGAAIIQEEWEEFWEEVKKNNVPLARKEAVQLAAMAARYLLDIHAAQRPLE